jgi:hypothetical protein
MVSPQGGKSSDEVYIDSCSRHASNHGQIDCAAFGEILISIKCVVHKHSKSLEKPAGCA